MTDIASPIRNHRRGRPPTISPDHGTKRIIAFVPRPIAEDLEAEAKRRRVSVARVIRDRLAKTVDGIPA